MINVTMPKLGLTMKEGTIIEWKKQEGESVTKGEVLFVIETEKVSYEVQSNESGILGKIVAREGDVVPVAGVVAYLVAPGEKVSAADAPAKSEPKTAVSEAALTTTTITPSPAGEQINISPLARKIAEENKLDITSIKGTGPGGRIVKEDVLRAIEDAKVAVSQPPPVKEAVGEASAGGLEEVKPLSSMRKIIAQRMTETFTVPHFYLTIEADVGDLNKAREARLPVIESKAGVRLTITDLLTKAVAMALEDNPAMNCSYVAGGSVKMFKRIDIGIVASVEGGLVVPVIRNANQKSLVELAVKRSELAQKAKDRKLTKEEMSGSTFTISNLGMFGIDQFCALLQPPEAAILAVGRTLEKPVVRDGQIVIRPMMSLTLSIDHRVLDGVVGANFLQSVKKYIENPTLMLI